MSFDVTAPLPAPAPSPADLARKARNRRKAIAQAAKCYRQTGQVNAKSYLVQPPYPVTLAKPRPRTQARRDDRAKAHGSLMGPVWDHNQEAENLQKARQTALAHASGTQAPPAAPAAVPAPERAIARITHDGGYSYTMWPAESVQPTNPTVARKEWR